MSLPSNMFIFLIKINFENNDHRKQNVIHIKGHN